VRSLLRGYGTGYSSIRGRVLSEQRANKRSALTQMLSRTAAARQRVLNGARRERADRMATKRRLNVESAPIGEKLLTLSEAAEVLRLHPRTVREYIRRGEITGRLIGRRWRFRRKELDAFFENAPTQWDFEGKDDHGD